MAVVGGLCAVIAAMVMIGWNVMITEKRRRRAQLRRRRSSSRMLPRKHVVGDGTRTMIVSKRRGRGWDSVEETSTNAAAAAESLCSTSSPCGEEDGRYSPPTPSTAPSSAGPSSAERCPPAPSPCSPSGPPCVFHDLVMILDAPALPSPRRKLPKLLEEIDTSTDTGFGVAKDAATPLSPPGGCDLSQGFHLSAPWSPPPRRGFPHRISGGNRPRTFSEYTAGPSTTADSIPGGGSSFRHVRAGSAMAGLSSVATVAAASGGREAGAGVGAAATRARGATYSDGDPFADLDMLGPFSNDKQIDRDDILMVWPTGKVDLKRNIVAGGGPACPSPSPSDGSENNGSGRKGRDGGGDARTEREMCGEPRPLYPYARTVLPVS